MASSNSNMGSKTPDVVETSSVPDAFLVTWNDSGDLLNPRNWPGTKKWRNVLLISIQATLSPMASVILAVASLEIAQDFNLTDSITPALPTALFVLGFGLGPLALAPLSEVYGRRIIYLTCFAAFTVCNILCSVAPEIVSLAIFRFLSGLAGSAGPSIGGGSIGDMFEPATRGRAQAAYSFGPTGGSAIGGVIGGFILAGTGNWRWLVRIMAIAAGVTSVASIFLLNETFPRFLLRKKAAALRKTTGNNEYHSEYDVVLSQRQLVQRNIFRALKMLVTEPACTAMSAYMALIYGILYLHMTTLPLLFSSTPAYGLASYEWPASLTGLSYLGVGIGSVLGVMICTFLLNKTYSMMKSRAERKGRCVDGKDSRSPEYRMPLMQIGAIIVPVGLFIFAFTAGVTTWIAPLIGAATFATGMLITYVCVTTYLVDTFEHFAASALAAMTMTRSLLGFVFSLIGFELYRSLGYQWGTLLLALLCVVLGPLPSIFYFWGPRLREKKHTSNKEKAVTSV